ncbi:MAG TPA: DUF5317 family protein [Mycobacteriales bacterium]|nr:DUF5317 family protein [Mycobacteriales bacterium]
MGLTVMVLLLAAAIGWLAGGSWVALVALPLRDRWLVAVAVAAQLAGAAISSATGRGYVAGLALSAFVALAFCLRNLRIAGVPLVAAGLICNAVVVGLNGSMPVSIDAAARANVPILSIATGSDPRHSVAGTGSTLRILGDVIPVPLPIRPEVVSPGDTLVAAGLAEWLVLGMRRRAQPRGRRRSNDDPATATAAVTVA